MVMSTHRASVRPVAVGCDQLLATAFRVVQMEYGEMAPQHAAIVRHEDKRGGRVGTDSVLQMSCGIYSKCLRRCVALLC